MLLLGAAFTPRAAAAAGNALTARAPAAVPATIAETTVWRAGNRTLGLYELPAADDGQCGAPVALPYGSFAFKLSKNGTRCARNQLQPTIDTSGDLVRLHDGRQYTFSFTYVDGTATGAAPGMGYDVDARSLIWQIHPYGGGNPCVGLDFYNGGYVGNPQQWLLTNCSGNVWSGAYTPGEADHWMIKVFISQTASGYIELFRNEKLVRAVRGATYSNAGGGSGDPWFNFGPYKWRWEIANGGSSMTQVNATIKYFTVTSP